MKRLVFLLALMVSSTLHAQRERAENYISTYKDIAIEEMQRTGVPASITLAQGILESQYGESDLVKTSNNHFGIKCKTEWTGAKTYHDDDTKKECFRVYPTAEESYKDHSNFLMTRDWYTFLFKLDPTDDRGWAYGLKKAGYATEKDYPQRLLSLINDYQLHQYSLMALGKMANTNGNSIVSRSAKKQRVINQSDIESTIETKTEPSIQKTFISATEPEEKNDLDASEKKEAVIVIENKKISSYPKTVFTINHTKVIYAEAGTSLLRIANQYSIALSKLFEFNELNEIDILNNDALIFLEKKLKKGSTDLHIVKTNETLMDISQTEGVRLEYLLDYNKLKRDTKLQTGDKIYLRTNTSNVSVSTKASK